jgi:hypothetical protein
MQTVIYLFSVPSKLRSELRERRYGRMIDNRQKCVCAGVNLENTTT